MVKEQRLIDANAMREDWLENGENEYVYDTNAVLASIDAQPTVDAVEVVHGRWEQCFEDWRQQIEGDKCSACGFEHYGCGIKHYHYCPNCGAKMDGGVDK